MALRRAVTAAVEDGEAAAADGAWLEVRTADLHFHQAIGALAQSPRVDEMMRRALAELRLVFHAMTDPEEFHGPYLGRNRDNSRARGRRPGRRGRAGVVRLPHRCGAAVAGGVRATRQRRHPGLGWWTDPSPTVPRLSLEVPPGRTVRGARRRARTWTRSFR